MKYRYEKIDNNSYLKIKVNEDKTKHKLVHNVPANSQNETPLVMPDLLINLLEGGKTKSKTSNILFGGRVKPPVQNSNTNEPLVMPVLNFDDDKTKANQNSNDEQPLTMPVLC